MFILYHLSTGFLMDKSYFSSNHTIANNTTKALAWTISVRALLRSNGVRFCWLWVKSGWRRTKNRYHLETAGFSLENLSCFDRKLKRGALPRTLVAMGASFARGGAGGISLQIGFERSGARRDVVLFDSNYRAEMMKKICRQRFPGNVLLNGDDVSEYLSRLDIIKISV